MELIQYPFVSAGVSVGRCWDSGCSAGSAAHGVGVWLPGRVCQPDARDQPLGVGGTWRFASPCLEGLYALVVIDEGAGGPCLFS